jgi:1,2-diacylglycerol 3-beta-glucosyltransferase
MDVATLCLAVACGLVTAYLLLLTVLAVGKARAARTSSSPRAAARHTFAILVPAHNEELLLPRLLDNLRQLDYPRDRYAVHVVADNCTDRTAERAHAGGAIIHERFDTQLKAKGFALRWVLQELRDSNTAYDAFIVLDADSVVSPNFLRVMDGRLASGAAVIQAYYSVLNVGDSALASLRYAALAALHYVRPLGRSALRLSCGLKGNGMCFASAVVDQFGWDWFTLAEDVEFHLALVSRGVRVDFACEATVLADMPVNLAQAASQNDRWERGRLQLARQRVPRLLLAGFRNRSLLQIDAALEQLIPPLSVPFALATVSLCVSLLLGDSTVAAIACLTLLGYLAHLMVGLFLVRAPRAAFVAFAYAPVYVVWKVSLYVRALFTARTTRWIRTVRAA